jgi:hypothetical protein
VPLASENAARRAGRATQGPSKPNSLDAEVCAARAEPADATVARGVLAIVICKDDGEHSRVTGYRAVRQLLRRAALDDDTVDRAVKKLHIGHAVVLVDAAGIAPAAVRAHLEQVAQAA